MNGLTNRTKDISKKYCRQVHDYLIYRFMPALKPSNVSILNARIFVDIQLYCITGVCVCLYSESSVLLSYWFHLFMFLSVTRSRYKLDLDPPLLGRRPLEVRVHTAATALVPGQTADPPPPTVPVTDALLPRAWPRHGQFR